MLQWSKSSELLSSRFSVFHEDLWISSWWINYNWLGIYLYIIYNFMNITSFVLDKFLFCIFNVDLELSISLCDNKINYSFFWTKLGILSSCSTADLVFMQFLLFLFFSFFSWSASWIHWFDWISFYSQQLGIISFLEQECQLRSPSFRLSFFIFSRATSGLYLSQFFHGWNKLTLIVLSKLLPPLISNLLIPYTRTP